MADVSTTLTIHLAVFDFPGIPYSTHLIRDRWRSKTESNLPHDIADREHNITVSQIIRWWHSENMIKIKWYKIRLIFNEHIDGLMQDCSNSIANTLELLQSCTKLSVWVIARLIIAWQ